MSEMTTAGPPPLGEEGAAAPYAARPWLALYPDGVGATLEPRFATMAALWDDAVSRRGGDPALCVFGTALTYAEVDAAATALAADLVLGGLPPGGRVAVLVQNDPQWAIALVAAWKAGGVAVSLSPLLKGRELSFELADAGASVLVCLEDLYDDVVRDVVAGSPLERVLVTHPADWVVDDEGRAHLAAASGGRRAVGDAERLLDAVHRGAGLAAPERAVAGDDVAALVYTSGTTGPPKAAMLTHAGMAYNAQVFAEWFRLGEDDPVLGIAPLFHVTGLVGHLAVSWYCGSPLVLSHRFDPELVLASVERWRPTFTIAAITAYLALAEHPGLASVDLSSLRYAASGGAPVTKAVVDRFAERTGISITSVYGLTETTSPSHLTPPGRPGPVDSQTSAISVGVPVPGAMVEVVDAATGEPVPPGTLGELVISGPMVVPGYWGKPDETAAAIPGGRLFTGDIGLMDDAGWFYVVDRKKDQINASGYKVWPREVEDVLYEHPAVREAAVVGVPDPYRGETVRAHVSLRAGASATEDELIAFCRERLASYKCPRSVRFEDELPKTSSGKLLRRDLRDRP
jgi:long-chain acyl-CoA synthetase